MKPLHLFLIVGCVVGIFASGFATGWLLRPQAVETPMTPSESLTSSLTMPEKMRAHLGLSDSQMDQLYAVMADWRKETVAIERKQLRAREVLFEQTTPKIRELLTVEQRPEFDRLVKSIDEKRKRLQEGRNP